MKNKELLEYIEKELNTIDINGVKIRYITDTEWIKIMLRYGKKPKSEG